MRKQTALMLILLMMAVLLPGGVLASRGGTDANGGHYDHTTGLYHYHHGYEAHQHVNGICPFTNEKWELKVPERPPTLEEWNAQKHSAGEKAPIDNETPENDDWKTVPAASVQTTESSGSKTSTTETKPAAATANSSTKAGSTAADSKEQGGAGAVPIAAAGGAVVLGGAVAIARGRKKKQTAGKTSAREEKAAVAANAGPKPEPKREHEPVFVPVCEPPAEPVTEPAVESVPEPVSVPVPEPEPEIEPDMSPEAVIPAGTVIGDDGLPWEAAAYAREKARLKAGGTEAAMDRSVATNFSEPRWGSLYSFCTDADGEEIHTLTCEMAFIQINAADRNCPKLDCPICKPVRPDLSWYKEYLKRKAEQPPTDEKA